MTAAIGCRARLDSAPVSPAALLSRAVGGRRRRRRRAGGAAPADPGTSGFRRANFEAVVNVSRLRGAQRFLCSRRTPTVEAVTVTDTWSGAVRTYQNPLNHPFQRS